MRRWGKEGGEKGVRGGEKREQGEGNVGGGKYKEGDTTGK